nr:MAG: ORF1 [TTV-like mini virus]
MPWRYRWRRRRQRPWNYYRPRRWLRRRRLRKPVRTTFYRRRLTVRRRRRKIHRKARRITVKTFQPKTVRKCKVKGLKCLIQCGQTRDNNNYAQYIYSYTKANTGGGGGWSMMVFSLASLYEDHQHLLNYWTTSNAGLNLIRYRGVKFKFYQHTTVDYVVIPRTCYPMTDTKFDHANSQPFRALMDKKKIIVPSIATKPLKRRSKTRFFYPPSEFKTDWYFQQKICNFPFIMLTTVSCSLTHTFLAPSWQSNNISLKCLNTHLFQYHNFENLTATTGYQPKPNTWLYTEGNGSTTTPTDKKLLICLANTKDYTAGKKIQNPNEDKMSNWGNPFYEHYLHPDCRIYSATKSWTNLKQNPSEELTLVTSPFFYECRYCPDKDDGTGNEVYFVKNYDNSDWQQPEQWDVKIDGFPLWICCWGWADWIKKLRNIQRVDYDHIMVIKTNKIEPKMPAYVFLDESFWNGKGIQMTDMLPYDEQHWHPQFMYQQVSINDICKCGPGTAKPPDKNSFSIKAGYTFYFTFGGCPSTLENIYDPCSQQVYPIPTTSNQYTGLQITNPAQPKETTIHDFDVKKDIITKAATKRIKEYSAVDTTMLSSTDCLSKSCKRPRLQTPSPETSDTEEEETTQEQQLKLLKHNQRLLKRTILKLMSNIE